MRVMGILPSGGTVTFDGTALDGDAIEERVAMGMALVPERRELFGSMTVDDNLVLGGFRTTAAERAQSLAQVFARFPRLQERRRQLAGTLSGGERQMLAMGRALMGRPRLLMLDEPSLGLAPLIVRDIFEIIVGLRKTGVSILLVEQNARAALQVADHAYVMELGEITAQRPCGRTCRRSAHRRELSGTRRHGRLSQCSTSESARQISPGATGLDRTCAASTSPCMRKVQPETTMKGMPRVFRPSMIDSPVPSHSRKSTIAASTSCEAR